MPTFQNSMLNTIDYETVRQAMNGYPFTMVLLDKVEIAAVMEAVNVGIDSHLEACYVPSRGDAYKLDERFVSGVDDEHQYTLTPILLDCVVSPESLPVLLRRLGEANFSTEEIAVEAASLQEDILSKLGVGENGEVSF